MATRTLRRVVAGALLVSLPALAGAQPAAASPDPMRALERLLGTWDVDDTFRAADGRESRDTGVRTCRKVLRDRYVECVTVARNGAGREREYRWLVNWNAETGRYDLVGVFSNWPGKVTQSIRIDSTGRTWNIRAPSSVDGGVEQWSWAQLVFADDDHAVWTSWRNRETESPQTWVQATRETWVRRRDGRR